MIVQSIGFVENTKLEIVGVMVTMLMSIGSFHDRQLLSVLCVQNTNLVRIATNPDSRCEP